MGAVVGLVHQVYHFGEVLQAVEIPSLMVLLVVVVLAVLARGLVMGNTESTELLSLNGDL